jgi:capsular polysaccharide biosynthesis protein
MLVSKRDYQIIYNLLPGMGWTKEQVEHVLAKESFATIKADPFRRLPRTGKYILLGFPGVYTYGHFLVDVSLRIQLAKAMGLHGGARFLIPDPVQSWQLPLLALAGISSDDCVIIGTADRFLLEEVYVPVISGFNGVLHRALARRAFDHMKNVMDSILGPRSSTRKFVSPLHITMSSDQHPRGVEQRERIVETLSNRFGIEFFDPLQLSFAQQVDKFRHASLVVGEDSSALHNILGTDDADLVVISPMGAL